MPDVRVSVMLLLCGASENELISHHKNIQEGTSSWNLSAPDLVMLEVIDRVKKPKRRVGSCVCVFVGVGV